MTEIERGKRIKIKPVDDTALIYASSAQEKYGEFIKEISKHPYKLYEHYTGEKLPLWKRIYMGALCKIKKTDYEKQQDTINKVIGQFIRKR